MATTAYAGSAAFIGTPTWTSNERSFTRSRFGDAVLLAFLLTQCFDGVFTYVGVLTYGAGIEANPIIVGLMGLLGQGVALAVAKGFAAMLGICLHLRQVHGAVAVLAGFYGAVAILPWTLILFR
jgi:uncharacterized membrane protein